MTEQWLEFCGKAVDNGTAWLLETHDGHGALVAVKDDVRLEEAVIRIRRGARVKVLKGSRGGYPVSLRVLSEGCPCGRSCCIGFIVVCCETGEVVNSAAGIWNECSQEPNPQPQDAI